MGGQYDYDWIIVGSGFGGSVSALRLAEKGYKVAVLECGKRFTDKDFPKSTWDVRRYFWAPRLGLRGIFRLSTFKDVSVVSGCGVGGGKDAPGTAGIDIFSGNPDNLHGRDSHE